MPRIRRSWLGMVQYYAWRCRQEHDCGSYKVIILYLYTRFFYVSWLVEESYDRTKRLHYENIFVFESRLRDESKIGNLIRDSRSRFFDLRSTLDYVKCRTVSSSRYHFDLDYVSKCSHRSTFIFSNNLWNLCEYDACTDHALNYGCIEFFGLSNRSRKILGTWDNP